LVFETSRISLGQLVKSSVDASAGKNAEFAGIAYCNAAGKGVSRRERGGRRGLKKEHGSAGASPYREALTY
jgi:hypothetical protein